MSETREVTRGEPIRPLSRDRHPAPLGSLTAAARRLTTNKVTRQGGVMYAAQQEGWQSDAWDLYDMVGEQRFLSNTLAGRLSQARFFVGLTPDNPTDDVIPIQLGDTNADGSTTVPEDAEPPSANDRTAYEMFAAMYGSGVQFAQSVARAGINLFVAGDCYLVGTRRDDSDAEGAGIPMAAVPPSERVGPPDEDSLGVSVDDLEWNLHSLDEVSVSSSDRAVTVRTDDGEDGSTVYDVDEIVLIRVWRPHPRKWWLADSPTRSSLPVLRELVGLTMDVSAHVDSRLAGAGLLLVPQEAAQAIKEQLGGADGDDTDPADTSPDADDDPFTDALIESMVTPIGDRASASAVVPLVVTVPGETIEQFRHLTFSTPLDDNVKDLRDEAIRRLALGQDCPPELLLGVAGMNHWGAWLVREDVVTTHLEPPLALLCDAITTQYLWPALQDQGLTAEEARRYVVWYDVAHLILRPNRSDDARALFDAGAISAASLRDATGFDETDAPEQTDPAVQLVLKMLASAPSLAQSPGLAVLVEQVRAVLSGDEAPAAPPAPEEGEAPPSPPPAEGEEETAPESGGGGQQGPPAEGGGSSGPPVSEAASAAPGSAPDLDGYPGPAAHGYLDGGRLDEPEPEPEPEPVDVGRVSIEVQGEKPSERVARNMQFMQVTHRSRSRT